MWKRLFLVLFLLAVVLGGIFGWKFYQMQQQMAGQAGPPPPVVAVSQVKRETWPEYLKAVGSLTAVSGIAVTNEVSGQVSRIHFESGQAVQSGDVLIELDATVDLAELDGLVAAQHLAQLKMDRVSRLISERSVSQAELDEAKGALDNTTAQVVAKRALIAKKTIRAPFSGVLGIRQVDLGEYLAPGSPIVPLDALDPVYADFSLPERYLARVAVGQEIRVEAQAYPGEAFSGHIEALDPGVDKGTRSLRLRAVLTNGDQRLRPGMFAEVRVVMPTPQEVLTLPATAIVYNPYGDSVFVIQDGEGGSVVQRRQIETGEVRDGRVAILQGLSEGDRAVSAGQMKLRNDLPVTIDDKPAPDERG
jgi:membrane fusion protein (multidrug efflux system)